MEKEGPVDVVAFGAHPDDVELTCGATLAKLAGLGYRTGVVDMTHGEMGSRGDRETRDREAAAASAALGLSRRVNLDLPDSRLEADPEAVKRAVEALRALKPSLVIAPFWREFHPDHVECSRIVQKACFLSGLRKFEAAGEPFRPKRTIFSMFRAEFRPSFVVDVSRWYDRRLEAIKAYRSQFLDPSSENAPSVDLSNPEFLERMVLRSRYYGSLIGAEYGEPFLSFEMIEIDDPVRAFSDFRGVQGRGLV